MISKEKLQRWVDYANKEGSLILFDAAYEGFISDPALPHTIYECEGAKKCCMEFRSYSKTAGFTGVRLGYTAVSYTHLPLWIHFDSFTEKKSGWY